MGVYTVNQTDGSLQRVAGGTLYADAPIGAIQSYGGVIAPAGWLICDGSAVSRTEYAELFAVIGISFGEGDGETTFGIPDLRECVPVGVGKNITKSIANHDRYDLGQFKDDALGTHDHPLKTVTTATYNTAGVPVGVAVNNTPTSATHGKQLGVNYIIKAKMVGVPADLEAQIDADYQKKDLTSAVEGETTVEDALGALSTNKQPKTLATPIVINRTSKTTVESALSSLADIAVNYSISSPAGIIKYYKFKNIAYAKVNNILIVNRYSTVVGVFNIPTSNNNTKAYAYRFVPATYGIAGIKLGVVTEGSTSYGVMYLKITNYNPLTIVQLDNRTVANYELTEITQQEYEDATDSTLSEFIEYTSLSKVPVFINSEQSSYSTSETNTGKTWIDGKPIYRVCQPVSGSVNSSGYSDIGASAPANMNKLITRKIDDSFPYANNIYWESKTSWKAACAQASTLPAGTYLIAEYTKTT